MLGVYAQVKIGLKKILLQAEYFFIKGTFCAKTPKQKKNGSKSEKYIFTNIFNRFFQRGKFLLKRFKQNSIDQKVKVTFCLEMVMFLLKKEKFLISSSHCSGPIVHWRAFLRPNYLIYGLLLLHLIIFLNSHLVYSFHQEFLLLVRQHLKSNQNCLLLNDTVHLYQSPSCSSSLTVFDCLICPEFFFLNLHVCFDMYHSKPSMSSLDPT